MRTNRQGLIGFAVMSGMLAALSAPPAQAEDVTFSISATEACLARAEGLDAMKPCVGEAANRCITLSPGGGNTVEMGDCLDAELTYWDKRLNASYRDALARAGLIDSDNRASGFPAPPVAQRLREMQRAWIPFRDASCEFEMSLWGGGTGAGPALIGCLLRFTGEQTLFLEQNWMGD